jgi:hypothetical protein
VEAARSTIQMVAITDNLCTKRKLSVQIVFIVVTASIGHSVDCTTVVYDLRL